MVLIALSIIVLVLCSRYKQEPMTNSRTGITVTTIITAVITFFELTGVVALGVMNGIFGCKALLNICGRLCVVYLLCSCGVYSLLFAVSRRGELIVAHTLVSLDTGDDTQSDNAAVVYHGYCKDT